MKESEKNFDDAKIEKSKKYFNEWRDRWSKKKLNEIRKRFYEIENKKKSKSYKKRLKKSSWIRKKYL